MMDEILELISTVKFDNIFQTFPAVIAIAPLSQRKNIDALSSLAGNLMVKNIRDKLDFLAQELPHALQLELVLADGSEGVEEHRSCYCYYRNSNM